MRLRARTTPNGSGEDVEPVGPAFGTDAVHVYNVLWGIPESMGGMTTAALRRIRSFQNYGSPLSQTILTFSPRMDTDEIRDRLIVQGKMRDDVELVNIWQDLRGRSEAELARLEGEPPRMPIPDEGGELENITAFYDVFRNTQTGAVIRRNYRRADGSLLLADIDDSKLGRRFVLHSPDGRPMTEWRRPRDFYNAWVSAVVTKEPAVVIVDEKKVSEFIHEISDRAFPLILFLHGTHLRRPWNGNHGQILPRRLDTIRNLDRFDIVGVQTEQQAEAVQALGFTEANIRLLTGELPESAMLPEASRRRPLNSAVMIANLIALKRIDHSIRAVAELRDRGIDVSLTVLGEGSERGRLEKLIDDLDLGDRVGLPGYVTDVSERLQSASFSMLTSTSEGLPLSMMESMGAGCIPIVYDITYGPRDLIEHGRNGFITPWSDIDALSDQIDAFLTLDEDRVEGMRREARKTVERYLPEAGYQRWQDALEEVVVVNLPDDRDEKSAPSIAAKKLTCEATTQGCRIEIELDRIHPAIAESLELVVAGRKLSTFFVSSSTQISTRRFGNKVVLTFDVDYAGFSESPDETFDVFLRRAHDMWTAKRRIKAPRRFRAVQAGDREWYSTKHGNLSVRPHS
ncbi:glycosyltransferase [Brevibacterium linens ATCC 9172]|uniref:Glycosyltransferase involved in cell wall bisynthesis n=1 Tax=Brevibacterium linens ATCC 9172 TaxID=1255617 RepID=A0A2H1K2Q7_BRELN|nr:glycosyltransferase [Brevibacterium linens ATCC 9172]SMX93848.1 Glycosyltransferase involved in cell wall bisynthesis [Brevibacterium linens ATCC 9172]